MRLLRIVLMALAVLSLTAVPAGAAVHHHHHGEAAAGAAGYVVADHDAAAADDHASSRMPCSAHSDGGKCCGMVCCGLAGFCPGTTASLAVRLPRVQSRAPVRDDRLRDGAFAGLLQEPPIAA